MSYFNFQLPLQKSKDYLMSEIDDILSDIKFCFEKYNENIVFYRKIVAMNLRKLLSDNNKLLNKYKFPTLNGKDFSVDIGGIKLKSYIPSSISLNTNDLLSLQEFLNQKIYWYELNNLNMPQILNNEDYEIFNNKKLDISMYYNKKTNGTYLLKKALTINDKKKLLDCFNKIHFNYISINDLIRVFSDKKAVHLDKQVSISYLFVECEKENEIVFFDVLAKKIFEYLKNQALETTDNVTT